MKLGTRFFGAACLLMITIASLAEGGAFEPDNVVRVDTVRVQVVTEIPLRVDTVYVGATLSCKGVLEMEDGRVIRFSRLKRTSRRSMARPDRYDGWYASWHSYRACGGGVVMLNGAKGYAWGDR